jgi:hypothetical protein
MSAQLLSIMEDFGRLWDVPGLAALLASRIAGTPAAHAGGSKCDDPCALVLAEHHRLLVTALRRAQADGEIDTSADLRELADALVGLYLVRRLRGERLQGWAGEAVCLVLGRHPEDHCTPGDDR